MSTNIIKTKFELGDQFLELAQEELNRPAEDVVSYMVCRSVKKSISSYLMGFLLKNKVLFNEEETVHDLLKKCQEVNNKFKSIDLSPITFTKDYEYSAEIIQMERGIDLAAQTKELIRNNY